MASIAVKQDLLFPILTCPTFPRNFRDVGLEIGSTYIHFAKGHISKKCLRQIQSLQVMFDTLSTFSRPRWIHVRR